MSNAPANYFLSDVTLDNLLNKDFFDLIGLSELPDDKKQEMAIEMAATIQGRAFRTITQLLGEKKSEQLDSLPSEQVLAFLEENGINSIDIMLQEAIKYRIEVATLFQSAITPA